MKIVVFGLAVSSSWGNGHATLWRGLCAALDRLGHTVVFFERDVPYYASHRDLVCLPGRSELILYPDWKDIRALAARHTKEADVAMVTSYCPDALAATGLVLDCPASRRVFYDLDTPVTLDRLAKGLPVEYIGPRLLHEFDLVLSYSGGSSIEGLRRILGARRAVPLYGHADPEVHKPSAASSCFQSEINYLGTYSADRDVPLRELFVEPARRLPERRFVIGGSLYGSEFPWRPNIYFVSHIRPADHAAFYCSARMTLNVTRAPMAECGYCPSGRLFEAAACGAPVLSDLWEGLSEFFHPGSEILAARTADDAMAALERSPEDLARIGRAARQRALECHTADARARELECILESPAGAHETAGVEAY